MRGQEASTSGFSLVEVVIAIFLIGLIAVALLPALWQGIRLSTQQSATATATRHLYSLIENARASPTCNALDDITTPDSISDGRGASIAIAGTYDAANCAKGAAVTVMLTATDVSGNQLARVDAQVYIP